MSLFADCYNALPSVDDLEDLYDYLEDHKLETAEERRHVWVELTCLRRDLTRAINKLKEEGIEVEK